MSIDEKGLSCPLKTWIAAACLGLFVVLLFLVAGQSWLSGIFFGVIVAGIFGVMVTWFFCRPAERMRSALPTEPVDPLAEIEEEDVTEAAPPVPPTSAPAATEPEPEPAPQPAAMPDPIPAPEPAPQPEVTPAGGGSPVQPAALATARETGADDLKKIKGVGPKLEALLNELGIYHYDQIAAWGATEVAWMDDNLAGFKGRVSRDGWVGQAATLAAGGATEFSERVDKGDVY